jgi:acetyl/propionyl-CoA carboxylase alpha subunit
LAVTPRGLRITVADEIHDVEEGAELGDLIVVAPGEGLVTVPGGHRRRVRWTRREGRDGALEVVVDGWRFEVGVEDLGRARLRERARRVGSSVVAHAPLVIRAPIPGRITGVRVVEGEGVESGAALVTLEAMKMENVVRAPRAGTIGRVAVGADQTVELGDTLLELA